MCPEIIPFQAEHIIDLMDVDDFIAQRAVMCERNMELGGLGWSAMLGGKCIGCAIIMRESAKYTIWVSTTPELLRHKLWFHRTSKQLYKQVREAAGAMPVQILCDTSNQKSLRWAYRFGFKATPHVILEAA